MQLFSVVALCAALVQAELADIAGADQQRGTYSRDLRNIDKTAAIGSEMIPRRDEHAVEKRQRQSCNSYSVYELLKDALECQEDYLTAVSEEIEKSDCRNEYYRDPDNSWHDYRYDSLCERPLDTRDGVRNCSDPCSERQFYYMFCTHLDAKLQEIEEECGDMPNKGRKCLFDKGDFCFLKDNLTNSVLVECYTSASVSSLAQRSIDCSDKCREAVADYVEVSGCCVDFWKGTSHERGPTIADIFSACEVAIPDACTSLSPPSDFLTCTRSGRSAALSASAAVTLPSLLALILAVQHEN